MVLMVAASPAPFQERGRNGDSAPKPRFGHARVERRTATCPAPPVQDLLVFGASPAARLLPAHDAVHAPHHLQVFSTFQ
jgi:hypothetical protein